MTRGVTILKLSVAVRSVPVLCCSTSQPCWSAACQQWSPCWSRSRWGCSLSGPVESRCCQTGTPCCTTQVQTTSTRYTAPRRPSTHCKYWRRGAENLGWVYSTIKDKKLFFSKAEQVKSCVCVSLFLAPDPSASQPEMKPAGCFIPSDNAGCEIFVLSYVSFNLPRPSTYCSCIKNCICHCPQTFPLLLTPSCALRCIVTCCMLALSLACLFFSYTIVLIYYAFCLVLMMLLRPLLVKKIACGLGKSDRFKSIYAALYFFPILTVLQAVGGGLLCE